LEGRREPRGVGEGQHYGNAPHWGQIDHRRPATESITPGRSAPMATTSPVSASGPNVPGALDRLDMSARKAAAAAAAASGGFSDSSNDVPHVASSPVNDDLTEPADCDFKPSGATKALASAAGGDGGGDGNTGARAHASHTQSARPPFEDKENIHPVCSFPTRIPWSVAGLRRVVVFDCVIIAFYPCGAMCRPMREPRSELLPFAFAFSTACSRQGVSTAHPRHGLRPPPAALVRCFQNDRSRSKRRIEVTM